jgi:Fe-S cluster biogenesis protein NfuA
MNRPTPFPSRDPATPPAPADEQERMRSLVDTLSAYIEYYHGGAVEFVSFDGTTLKIKMKGACLGCPLSPHTLHGWVEGTARQFFPRLENVEAV